MPLDLRRSLGLQIAGAVVLLFGLATWLVQSRPGPAVVRPFHRTVAPAAFEITPDKLIAKRRCGFLDGVRLHDAGGVVLWGWAFDPRSGQPAPEVVVSMNGEPLPRSAAVDRRRTDVRKATKKDALLVTGWGLQLTADQLSPGEHTFIAHARFDDGKFCPLRLPKRNSITVPAPE
ncbi:MAG: hypothetical protein AAF560_23615 [Acidobacteriota bacterium]